jgi:CRISPR type I-E-associated protein CasB/Cse2
MNGESPVAVVQVTVEEGKGRSLAARLGWLARQIHSDRVSRGDRAELRRMRSDGIPPAAYWNLTQGLDPVPPERDDPFWMTVMALMAKHRHEQGARPGRVLAEAGVKGARVERWLRRERTDAWREARRLMSVLGEKGVDWGLLGSLLYRWDDTEYRRRFARDFFRAEPACERARSGDEPEQGEE